MQTPEASLPYRIPSSKDHKSLGTKKKKGVWGDKPKEYQHQLLNIEKLELDFIREEYQRPIPDHEKEVLQYTRKRDKKN